MGKAASGSPGGGSATPSLPALRAHLFLHALLPIAFDHTTLVGPFARSVSVGDSSVLFAVEEMDRGTSAPRPPPGGRGSLSFLFDSPERLNAFFAGKPTLPRGALRHPLLTARVFARLASLRMLQPGAKTKDPRRRVALTIRLAALGLSEMNRAGHPETVALVAASPDRVYEWHVEETGDRAWVRMRDGKTRAGSGAYPRRRPFVRFVFPTVDAALRVFTTTASQMEAVERGWVTTWGSPEYTRKVSGLLQRLDALLMA
jgi:hypothetical protein